MSRLCNIAHESNPSFRQTAPSDSVAYSNNLAINFSNIIDAHIEESMNERARIRILAHESGPSFTQTAPSDPMADSKDRGRTFRQIIDAQIESAREFHLPTKPCRVKLPAVVEQMQTFEIEERVAPLATACNPQSQGIERVVQAVEMDLEDNKSMDSDITQPEEIAEDIQQIETKDQDDTQPSSNTLQTQAMVEDSQQAEIRNENKTLAASKMWQTQGIVKGFQTVEIKDQCVPLSNTSQSRSQGQGSNNKNNINTLKHSPPRFTLFPKLPPEVRCMIWATCFPKGRYISIYHHQMWLNPAEMRSPNPITLMINRESRRETRRKYAIVWGQALPGKRHHYIDRIVRPRPLVFNPHRDTLFFMGRYFPDTTCFSCTKAMLDFMRMLASQAFGKLELVGSVKILLTPKDSCRPLRFSTEAGHLGPHPTLGHTNELASSKLEANVGKWARKHGPLFPLLYFSGLKEVTVILSSEKTLEIAAMQTVESNFASVFREFFELNKDKFIGGAPKVRMLWVAQL
jgi:hypothetical protein